MCSPKQTHPSCHLVNARGLFLIYHGKGPKGAKKIWTKIGAVWPNKTGNGSTITWEYLPLADGITVMLPYDKRHADVQIVPDEYPA